MRLGSVRPEWLLAAFALAGAAFVTSCGSSDDGDVAGSGGALGGSGGTGGSTTGGTGGSTGGSGGTGGTGGAQSCSDIEIGGSALTFDGVDDHVTMGVAPELGLAKFTIEAWVRRDGVGQTFGTGVGGVTLVPIAGKGRGEADGSNVDCNYAFGFAGDTLGVDFEDQATGANHPLVGTTAIPIGEWHHVAATFDGASLKLYVDGELDSEAAVTATPRADSIQHFGIGTAFDSKGAGAGRLHGAVDELRVWDHARTATEIASAMYKTLSPGDGLVGRWALDSGDATKAPDALAKNDGTIVGATFITPGAILDLGAPPTVSSPTPSDGTVVSGTSATLGVSLSDPDGDPLFVSFQARELTVGDDFAVVVLPDTQNYTIQGNNNEKHFYAQTKWIVDNRDKYKISAVIHNGDIVQNGDTYEYEWTVADKAMKAIEVAQPSFPDGMPYGLGVGNHDQEPLGNTGATLKFNQWFGVSRFQSRAYYGGHYGSKNDENWFTFSAGGLDFVVISLQYDTSQDPAVIAWARSILLAHPNHFGIVNSHFILDKLGQFGAQGKAIYEGLKDIDNLQLLTCGHIAGESRRTDNHQGNVIHSMLADFQARVEGGTAWLRLWEFSPANGELTVRTYSPSLDKWEIDDQSEFTVPVDLGNSSTGTFAEVGKAAAVTTSASATYSGLAPGKTYEWYAKVTDCVHTVESPIARFSTP